MKNMGNMMKQAQKLQAKMMKMQEELGSKTVEASSGGALMFFGALGLMWVSGRRGLPSTVFVVAYSLFYLFVSVGSLTW